MRAGTKGDLSSETLGLYHQRLVSTWEIKLMSNILFRTMRVHIQNSWILISLPYVVCFGTNEQKKWHLFHKDHVFKEQNWIWYFFYSLEATNTSVAPLCFNCYFATNKTLYLRSFLYLLVARNGLQMITGSSSTELHTSALTINRNYALFVKNAVNTDVSS